MAKLLKGPSSSSVSNYRLISLTPILSKVFERLGSVHLGRFMEDRCVLPTAQFAYRKGLGTCDALLCVVHTLQGALEMGQEARIVQIDFSAAFDSVNPQGILFKVCSVGVGASVLSVLTQILSIRSQYVVVDGCRSKLFNVVPKPNQKFIVVETSRMIVIHRSSVDLRRRPSSAFQPFPIISNAGNAAFPMLALVRNARNSVL